MQPSNFQWLIPLLFSTVLVFLLPACTPQPKGPSVDDDVIRYLETLKSGDIEAVLDFYGEKFYKGIAKQQWRDRLTELNTSYGPVIRYSLRNKQADTRFSGKFYIYLYDTVHQLNNKEKRVKHVLTFIRPIDDVTKVELVGHKITVK